MVWMAGRPASHGDRGLQQAGDPLKPVTGDARIEWLLRGLISKIEGNIGPAKYVGSANVQPSVGVTRRSRVSSLST